MPEDTETIVPDERDLTIEPDFAQWSDLARASAAAASAWEFEVAGVDARVLRARAREEALIAAEALCRRLGIPAREIDGVPELIVATGHQPELYHPGVWAKDFLLQRLARETGAAAIDIVVDTDGFESVGVHAPCLAPGADVCRATLALGTRDGCYACTAVPSPEAIDAFVREGAAALDGLPIDGPFAAFRRFADELTAAVPPAQNLAELVTLARRRYEAPAGTDYLELAVTGLAGSPAFAHFVVQIALDATAFASAYNTALGDFRVRIATRSAAQPFPDLATTSEVVELPFWVVGAKRRAVSVRVGAQPALLADGEALVVLGADPALAVERLLASGLVLAPKALALTLFVRMFVADLFIHGIGGGRYDRVTDDVARRYFGVEAPAFVVASLTVRLPLGMEVISDAEIDEGAMALNRLEHNPDQMIGEASFASAVDADRAAELVGQKRALVAEIAQPDADKKRIGIRIREVNTELAALLAPVKAELTARLTNLRRAGEVRDVLTDRTYPFCFWDPREIASLVDPDLATRTLD